MKVSSGRAELFGMGSRKLALAGALPLLLSLLLACGEAPRPALPGGASAGGAGSPATAPSGLPATLASRIVGASDLKQAVAATQQALAQGGIATKADESVQVQAAAPPSSLLASPAESFALALEARGRASTGRLALAELGNMLRDFGWPFQKDSTPGEQLAQFLSVWVTEAQRDPGTSQNFTPLFMAELAKRQIPPVALASGGYAPEELRLSLLELQLFAAAFDRAIAAKAKTAASDQRWQFASVAHAAEPCSAAKGWVSGFGDIGKAGAEVGNVAFGEGTSKAMEAGVNKLGLKGATFGSAMSALGISARLFKLVSLYSNGKVEVSVESENPLHKPLSSEASKFSAFTARAGISDKDWKEYKEAFASDSVVRSLRDCASLAGLPVLTDLGDIAKEAENWRVEWRLVEGSPEHAYISIDPNTFNSNKGQLEMNLKRDGENSASATLVVDITPETGAAHSGPQQTARLTAKAELETSSPPGLGTVTNAFKGGMGDVLALADALVELGAGWFQEMVQPEAFATLNVTYHEAAGGWKGTITSVRTTQKSDAVSTYLETFRKQVTVTGPASIPGLPAGAMQAGATEGFDMLGGTVAAQYQKAYKLSKKDNYQGAFANAFAKYCTPGTSTQSSTGQQSAQGKASVMIMVLPGGQVSIIVNSDDQLVGVVKSEFVDNSYDLDDNKGTCKMTTHTRTDEMPIQESLGGINVMTTADPKNPKILKGSKTESSGGDTTTTITWSLSRN